MSRKIAVNVVKVALLVSTAGFMHVVPAIAETESGQLVFNNNCRTCHSMDKGDHRLGPSLHNIVGKKAGSSDGYGFSPSLQNSNITWTEDNLNKFITDPDALVPGNQMQPYGGLESAEERKTLIKFLANSGK